MQTPSVPSSPVPSHAHTHRQKTLLAIIIVAALIAFVWVMRGSFFKKPLTLEEQHQVILEQIAADSQKVAATISAETKASIFEQVAKDSNPAPAKKGTPPAPTLTAEQKAEILKSVSQTQ